jgi:aminoglycoside phosphotransferase (APT) family kinase protein
VSDEGGAGAVAGAGEMVRGVVAGHLPGYRVASVVVLGQGLDNTAYLVNDELIVRFSQAPSAEERAMRVEREAGVLAAVGKVSPLAVPVPAFVAAEAGCLAYFKVDGVPVPDLPRAARTLYAAAVGARLGEFLGAIHALPIDRMAELVDVDDDPSCEWLREAAESYPAVAAHVPPRYRPRIEAFFAAPPPDHHYTPVFSHNDLGVEHVLVDPQTWSVSGIIDWSDAAIDDPAYDFGLIYRDLGPLGLDAALGTYRTAEAEQLRERAVFYARCSVFEDLTYGVQMQRGGYRENALAALGWLFPTQG